MRKVVVTGVEGFIGSNLTEELAKKKEVIIIDNLSIGRMENIRNIIKKDNIEFINGSISDLKFLNITNKDVDCIFHQAVIPSVPYLVQNPLAMNEANINGFYYKTL
jgi:UDP-glucose 4-epimerase